MEDIVSAFENTQEHRRTPKTRILALKKPWGRQLIMFHSLSRTVPDFKKVFLFTVKSDTHLSRTKRQEKQRKHNKNEEKHYFGTDF